MPPPYAFISGGERRRWTAAEYQELVKRSGELALSRLEPQVQRGAIDPLEPTEVHIDTIRRELARARRLATDEPWNRRSK